MNALQRDFKNALPLLTAIIITIIVAAWQYITVLQSITFSHPYSDVLHYLELVGEQQFFGPTHFSWRILFPGLITALHIVLPFSASILWMSTNILLFSVLLFGEYRLSFNLTRAHQKMLIGIFAVIMFHPAFWRGAFLPMLEIPLFFTIWLMLRIHKESAIHPAFFALMIFLSLWVKEMMILTWLFGLIIYRQDLFRRKAWISWHLPFLLSGLLYAIILFTFSASAPGSNNYLLQPGEWLSDWLSLFSASPATILKSFVASTGLLWIALPFIMRFFHVRIAKNWIHTALVISLIWLIISLFTVTNAPRLIWPFYAILPVIIPQK